MAGIFRGFREIIHSRRDGDQEDWCGFLSEKAEGETFIENF